MKRFILWALALAGVSAFASAVDSPSAPVSTQYESSINRTVAPYTPTSVPTRPKPTVTDKQVEETYQRSVPATDSGLSNDNYYTNVNGNTVHSPAKSIDGGVPAGASAQCRDGTYSFSQNRRGTCSHHGGVSEWL